MQTGSASSSSHAVWKQARASLSGKPPSMCSALSDRAASRPQGCQAARLPAHDGLSCSQCHTKQSRGTHSQEGARLEHKAAHDTLQHSVARCSGLKLHASACGICLGEHSHTNQTNRQKREAWRRRLQAGSRRRTRYDKQVGDEALEQAAGRVAEQALGRAAAAAGRQRALKRCALQHPVRVLGRRQAPRRPDDERPRRAGAGVAVRFPIDIHIDRHLVRLARPPDAPEAPSEQGAGTQ